MLACAAPEMAQLAAEYRIQHSEGDQTEMKQVGSQQHASWHEKHEVPIAELTPMEFRKELIAVSMLKSAASRNIIGCGGGIFSGLVRVGLNGCLGAQQEGQVH